MVAHSVDSATTTDDLFVFEYSADALLPICPDCSSVSISRGVRKKTKSFRCRFIESRFRQCAAEVELHEKHPPCGICSNLP